MELNQRVTSIKVDESTKRTEQITLMIENGEIVADSERVVKNIYSATLNNYNEKLALMKKYHVSAYGAVGDGVTNDRTAINNAIIACNSGGGGLVVFDSNKTYFMGDDVKLKNNVHLMGGVNTVIKNNIDKQIIYLGLHANETGGVVRNIGIHNIKFVGEFVNAGGISSDGLITCNNQKIEGLYLSNVTIEAPLMKRNGFFYYANTDGYLNDAVFENCSFVNNGRMGMELSIFSGDGMTKKANNIIFKNNFVGNNGLAGGESVGCSIVGALSNVLIEGSIFRDSVSYHLELGGFTDNVVVRNCVFVGRCTKAIAETGSGTKITTNLVIENNYIDAGESGEILFIASGVGTVVRNNIMIGKCAVLRGISTGCDIYDNDIFAFHPSAFEIDGSNNTNNHDIHDNFIQDVGLNFSNAVGLFNGDPYNNRVFNNKILSNQSSIMNNFGVNNTQYDNYLVTDFVSQSNETYKKILAKTLK